jgi:glycerophosphoryl diester phosphodiesterase
MKFLFICLIFISSAAIELCYGSDSAKAFYTYSHVSRIERFLFEYRRELIKESDKTIRYNFKKTMSIIPLIPLWFYEQFRFCPDYIDISDRRKNFYVIGHRGSPANKPENTIESFKAAIEEGANGIETDICITKDHKVIHWHDWNPNSIKAILREWGLEPDVKYYPHTPDDPEFLKPVNELTYEEFSEHYTYGIKDTDSLLHDVKIPTLEEFFIWGVSENRLKLVSFDLKTPYADSAYADIFFNELKRLKDKYDPQFKIIIETVHPEMALYFRNNFSGFSVTHSIEPGAGLILDPSEHSLYEFGSKNNFEYGVAVKPRDITLAKWSTFRRIVKYDLYKREANQDSGYQMKALFGATINDEKEMECLIMLGIDGLQTDFPSLLRRTAEKLGKEIE